MALESGARLGPYEIIAPLGAGGMGEVYRARDTRLGRTIAVKVLPAVGPGDADSRRRLLQEARAASALNHPNIVAVYDVGTELGSEFVAMELVDGRPLSDLLIRSGLPLADALKYAVQIADAVAAAHAAGIVHRDLKPTNVMVTGAGAIKVLDFGIAKAIGAGSGQTATITVVQTAEGQIIGTPNYMSPEQAEGRPVDPRSDIFSFGSMLYEMITGRVAFRRDTALATLTAITRDEPQKMSAVVDAVPHELERIVTKCLRKDPARRAQSMADLRVALEDVRDDLVAGRIDSPTSAAPQTTRRISKAELGFIAAALLVGIAVGALVIGRNAASGAPDGAVASLPTALTRVTYDDGYADSPALSPDGKLIAFASDRAGADNLDIWVQQVSGGNPVQLTRGGADERDPSFSPDGGQIVYRSEAEGGALYTIPALGGEPRLLVERGINGRYSPDGRRIAYWTGSQIGTPDAPGSHKTFVMALAGGASSELKGFTGARYPAWSPDGQFLVVAAHRGDASSQDWWMVRLADGEAFQTGAAAAFRAAGVEGFTPRPAAWIGNQILAATGDHLWSVVAGPAPAHSAQQVHRLTFGPGEASQPSASRDGLVAFVGSTATESVWAMPLDPDTGKVRGELRPLTEGSGPSMRASISANGRLLAFSALRSTVTVLVKDQVDGRVVDLAVPARLGGGGPVISPDGTKVVYPASDDALHVVPTRGGQPRKLCEDCVPGDWTSDSRHLTMSLGRRGIELMDVGSGARVPIIKGAGRAYDRPHLSPDDQWLAFRGGGEQGARVFVAPVRPGSPPAESEWIPITDPETDVRPCGWAPSARMVYFVSSRDGFRCLYAQPFDPVKGQKRGPAQLVRHFHNFRSPGGSGASVISTGAGNAITKDMFLLDFSTAVSNIWTMKLP
jgi:Tol biopolymer transport system component